MRWTIYKITSKTSGKSYIGQTKHTIEKRWLGHSRLSSRRPLNYFGKAIKKYSKSDFYSESLCYTYSQKDANELEQLYIKMFNTLAPHGYNSTSGGGQFELAQHVKEKISESVKNSMTQEVKEKISLRTRERMNNVEIRKKISKKVKEAKSIKKDRSKENRCRGISVSFSNYARRINASTQDLLAINQDKSYWIKKEKEDIKNNQTEFDKLSREEKRIISRRIHYYAIKIKSSSEELLKINPNKLYWNDFIKCQSCIDKIPSREKLKQKKHWQLKGNSKESIKKRTDTVLIKNFCKRENINKENYSRDFLLRLISSEKWLKTLLKHLK